MYYICISSSDIVVHDFYNDLGAAAFDSATALTTHKNDTHRERIDSYLVGSIVIHFSKHLNIWYRNLDNNSDIVWMVVFATIYTPFGWLSWQQFGHHLDGCFWQRFGRRLDGCFDIELRERKSRAGGIYFCPMTVVHKEHERIRYYE